MGIFRLFFYLLVLSFCVTSCSDDEEKCELSGPKGKYMIEVFKYGPYTDFKITSNVNAGKCSKTRFYNEGGVEFNHSYLVENEENLRQYTKYYTDSDATFLSFNLSAYKLGESTKDSMKIKAIGYFNDKKLFEVQHVFFTWSAEDFEIAKLFNTYSTELTYYLLDYQNN